MTSAKNVKSSDSTIIINTTIHISKSYESDSSFCHIFQDIFLPLLRIIRSDEKKMWFRNWLVMRIKKCMCSKMCQESLTILTKMFKMEISWNWNWEHDRWFYILHYTVLYCLIFMTVFLQLKKNANKINKELINCLIHWIGKMD